MPRKGKKAKPERNAIGGRPLSYGNLHRVPDGPSATVGVKLPIGYLRILELEASYWEATRSQFLSMLLKRRLGWLSFERPKMTPNYDLSEKELKETKAYLWYLHPELKAELDRERLQMGRLGTGAWIVMAVNEWLGKPRGFVAVEPKADE